MKYEDLKPDRLYEEQPHHPVEHFEPHHDGWVVIIYTTFLMINLIGHIIFWVLSW